VSPLPGFGALSSWTGATLRGLFEVGMRQTRLLVAGQCYWGRFGLGYLWAHRRAAVAPQRRLPTFGAVCRGLDAQLTTPIHWGRGCSFTRALRILRHHCARRFYPSCWFTTFPMIRRSGGPHSASVSNLDRMGPLRRAFLASPIHTSSWCDCCCARALRVGRSSASRRTGVWLLAARRLRHAGLAFG